MEQDMKVSGKIQLKKDLEYSIILMEQDMRVNGEIQFKKDMEYSIILMKQDMKVNGKIHVEERFGIFYYSYWSKI